MQTQNLRIYHDKMSQNVPENLGTSLNFNSNLASNLPIVRDKIIALELL